LAQAVDELQAVSELAPYVQALLDSRIVEMGSNANGEYVRWENGLQVVFGEANLGSISLSAHGSVYASPDLAVTLPAAFSTGVYAWHVNSDRGIGNSWAGLGSQAQEQAGSIIFKIYGGIATPVQNHRVSFFAIGR